MLKKVMKFVFGVSLVFLILPYFIPRDFNQAIPEKPYPNSVFFSASDGVRLHGQWFEAKGEVQGKLLMIHGLGASTFSYRNNAPFFAEQGFHVLVVDLPAFGYSSKAPNLDHSQAQRSRYLWAWLDEFDQRLDSSEAWHLVGHSMGGSTVLAMTEQAPTRVASMNLIAGAVTSTNQSSGWIFQTPLGEWIEVALRYFIITEDSFTSTLESAYNQVPTQADVLGYVKPLQTQGTPSALVDFVRTASNVTIQDFSVTGVPLHLLWGDQDDWVSVESIAEIQAHATVDAVVIFPGEGHCVHETSPTFNQELLKLLVKP